MKITPRASVDPEEGIREYGDVLFGNPVNNRYPVATPEHIHAAWSPIHHERKAAFSSAEDVACLERRIREATEAQGITLGGRWVKERWRSRRAGEGGRLK